MTLKQVKKNNELWKEAKSKMNNRTENKQTKNTETR